MHKMMKMICVLLGFVFLGLGVAGMLIPVLPTTPFFILTAACFAKGSTRFHKWFIATKIYRNYMQSTIEKKEMTRKAKVRVLITVTLLLTIAFFVAPIWHAKAAIVLIVLFHYVYFLVRIKTIPEAGRQTMLSQEENGCL